MVTYGLERVGYIAVVDLGHEIFIWFVFLPMLLIKRDGVQEPKEIIKSFISSPVVIAIIGSLFLNIIGASKIVYQLPFVGGVMATLDFLSKLTVPLILIIVGFGIKFDRNRLGKALGIVALRFGIMTPIILIVNKFLIRNYLNLDQFFEIAVFTLLMMPPPFIVPLYADENLDAGEMSYINNVLALHSVISVSVFVIFFIFNSSI